ncbi:MAG: hypothetical protein JWN12_182 [Candidatus Saccharibacteria bacterium]|nr:hypothetical protein [Candidatus Saccharibacteria bacterium]
MMERARVDDTAHSRRLPPLEAWKDPEQWLDLQTGLQKSHIDLIEVPYKDGLVNIDAFVQTVSTTLFKPDYEWQFNPRDVQTRPDDHHFYFTKNEYNPLFHDGDETPQQFRELPVNLGRVPRQFHNAIHDFAEKPVMPNADLMHDYIQSYHLAHTAFKNLYISAKLTLDAMGLFPARRETVARRLLIPKYEDDAIGEEILRLQFKKHFSNYERAVEQYLETEGKEIVYKEHETLKVTRPQIVVRKVGAVVSRRSVVIRLDSLSQAA